MSEQTQAHAQAGPRREWLFSALHLFVLSSFAIAQPLLDLLAPNAAFFAARKAPPIDVFAVVLGLILLPPAALVGVEGLAFLIRRSLGRFVHRSLVLALAVIILLPLLKRVPGLGDPGILTGSALGGGLALLAYVRVRSVGTILTLLGPAPLIFSLLFLLHGDIAPLLTVGTAARIAAGPIPQAGDAEPPDVIMVVFDELSLPSLLNDEGQIDAELFPNFARLAAGSTWMRNATTSAARTAAAVTSMLTGRAQKQSTVAAFAAHPENLFALLRSSHRMVVDEGPTSLSPPDLRPPDPPSSERLWALAEDLSFLYAHVVLPPDAEERLPPIAMTWQGFWRQGTPEQPRLLGNATWPGRSMRFRNLIGSMERRGEPVFYYIHLMLPHSPWNLLPSGQHYAVGPQKLMQPGWRWLDEEWVPVMAYQRYLLQVGFTDLLLGELLDRLEAQKLYDQSLLIVLSDHGLAFEPGEFRRRPTELTLDEIMHVPFFVKLPFQREGRILDRNVESIDVLPTITDTLGIEIPWEVDGRSALEDAATERETKRVWWKNMEWSTDAALPQDWRATERHTSLFGKNPTWEDIYRMSTRPDWVGRLADLRVEPGVAAAGAVFRPKNQNTLGDGADDLPHMVTGTIHAPPGQSPPSEVAVALNGVIWAVVPTTNRKGRRARFTVMLSEDARREGRDALELFAVTKKDTLKRITL